MGRRRTEFEESALMNNRTYLYYYNRFMELAISEFEWKNIPDSIDPRYLELGLFANGMMVFFMDEVMGYLCLRCVINGKFNVYRIPINRRAIADNGYNRQLNENNSVIIYNNLLHNNSKFSIELFAKRLYNLDRIIDVNANAQKTPILIACPENERLTLENIYKEYDGNSPVIKGEKEIQPNTLRAISTGAPYVADKIYQLKTQIFNEALTELGISNINMFKRERMITDEVQRNMGSILASRFSRLNARKQACDQINRMFGLNIDVEFREDILIMNEDNYLDDSEVKKDE